jgi:hypothetical protein
MNIKKALTIKQYHEILESSLKKNNFSKLRSLKNKYLSHLILSKSHFEKKYENLDWNNISIKVEIILNEDLSIQSEELLKLIPYQNHCINPITDSEGDKISFSLNISQIIKLHNLQLDCVIYNCLDKKGDEIIHNNIELNELLFNNFSKAILLH